MISCNTASRWDAYWQKATLPHDTKIIEELENVMSLNGKRVIEVGAGAGATAIALARRGANVTCIDFSSAALLRIRQHAFEASTYIRLIKADAAFLPIKSSSFDVCYHQGLLEHFKDPKPIINENYRVLRCGGVVLVDVPQRYTLYTVRKQIKIKRGKWFAGWETQFSLRQLKKLLVNAGFEFIKAYGKYHIRNLDRIQKRIIGCRVVPLFVETIYSAIIKRLENTLLGCYTAFSLGILARKPLLGTNETKKE